MPDSYLKSKPAKAQLTNWQDRLICHRCQLAITHPDYLIEVDNKWDHIQLNPAGVTFIFRCYNRAPGIIEMGDPVNEHTWFAGHHWQLALCQGCGDHMGWLFTGNSKFFALLNKKLKQVSH